MKIINKVFKIIFKICIYIMFILCALILICALYNFVCSRMEKGNIQSYGQLINVSGKNMNVVVEGDGDDTIVLLPGYGTASPALDFKGLVNKLKTEYKVITIEPFGYGLSDDTNEERTIEIMNQELHDCLNQLGVEEYYLAGHSIAGIYGLNYINSYPEEVKGYIGLDTTVPYQINDPDIPTWIYPLLKHSGVYRLLLNLVPESYQLPFLSSEENEQLAKITLKNLGNNANINEGKLFKQNLQVVQNLKYPDNLPVIFLLSSVSVENDDYWKPEHEKMIEHLKNGKVVILDGQHYIHHGNEDKILQEIKSFFQPGEN